MRGVESAKVCVCGEKCRLGPMGALGFDPPTEFDVVEMRLMHMITLWNNEGRKQSFAMTTKAQLKHFRIE